MRQSTGNWRCLNWTVAYLFLIVLFINGHTISFALFGIGNGGWQSRAKGTLRSIGSAELAYLSNHKFRVYGSLAALQKEEDIAKGYTLGNMIENYSLTWEVTNISTPTEDLPGGVVSTFKIIAWPLAPKGDYTFAITEDQVVRVYDPKRNNLNDVKSWDPIL
jgi:hypothetical protein